MRSLTHNLQNFGRTLTTPSASRSSGRKDRSSKQTSICRRERCTFKWAVTTCMTVTCTSAAVMLVSAVSAVSAVSVVAVVDLNQTSIHTPDPTAHPPSAPNCPPPLSLPRPHPSRKPSFPSSSASEKIHPGGELPEKRHLAPLQPEPIRVDSARSLSSHGSGVTSPEGRTPAGEAASPMYPKWGSKDAGGDVGKHLGSDRRPQVRVVGVEGLRV